MQWNDGRRGQDGWGRYTRRRKWYRDAELVELSADSEQQLQAKEQQSSEKSNPSSKSTVSQQPTPMSPMSPPTTPISKDTDSASIFSTSQPRKRGSWFRSNKTGTPSGGGSSGGGGSSDFSGSERSTLRGTEEEDVPELPPGSKEQQARDWEIDDDVKMSLG